jgi:hypothetical protein
MTDMPCFFMSSETHKKIGPWEPTFVLRAQDITAPDAVDAWIELARRAVASREKLEHAALHAKAMGEWQGKKKVPD